MSRLSPRDLLLLALLTVFWGVNWPVMKLGVAALPPLYFRTLCLGGGLIVIGAWARLSGISLAVPRAAWREVIWLAVPNMIVWHVLAIQAVKMLPSGRAAILGYTMPVWAVLAGLAFFGERPLPRHWLGVTAALLGTLLLLSSEFTALAGSPLGTALMLIAAAAWGFGTHLMRRHLIDLPIITLTFWMMALTVLVMLAFSIALELDQWRWPTVPEWFPLIYNIFFAVAFCHVVWSMLARKLPPAASGLSVMLIPVLGVFSGMWILGEQPHWQDYVALGLILFSLTTVLLPAHSAGAAPRTSS
jgi:drug/metabolite transporter (DMT)-like permease